MTYFYTKNDSLIDSHLNRGFPDLLNCSYDAFVDWINELSQAVTTAWDQNGQPPFSGVRLEDIGPEFERVCRADTSTMLCKDEVTRDTDCIIDSTRVYVANNFFPNLQKAKDAVGSEDAVGLYDLFASEKGRRRLVDAFQKGIREDAFKVFSKIFRVAPSFRGSLRNEARRVVKSILLEEQKGTSQQSFWIDAAPKTEPRTPRISVRELKQLQNNGLLLQRHLNGVNLETVSDDALFRIRIYSIGTHALKVLPTAFNFLSLSGIHAPNNFPAAVAKFLYQFCTEHIPQDEDLVIYDPSMGFGGRLLGALSLRERSVHYVGTDPNTENWLPSLGISRYEYLERTFKSHVKYGKSFTGTYICCGSEEVSAHPEFSKLKGKIDFIFTSPPYFSAEIYTDEPTQSALRYPSYEQWRDLFLRPTLETCTDWLRPNRYLAFNIADITIGNTIYPLEADTVQILQESGLRFVRRLKYVLSKSPSMKVKRFTAQPSTKNYCVVNGRWRKYEPIFVFYKDS